MPPLHPSFPLPHPQVLLLDADNSLLLPPERVFEAHQFSTHGNLFWCVLVGRLPEAVAHMI